MIKMKNSTMGNKQNLKIATLNLNGETWRSINRRPRLPQKLFNIQSIKEELTNLTKTGLENLLKGGEYDVIAIQELIYSTKEREDIKTTIEKVTDENNQTLYELLLPNNLGGHEHFTVGFIVKKRFCANLINENKINNSENILVKNRIAVLELTINKKKYSIINMHVNNHKIDIPTATENKILLGDMNACTEYQATDKKAVNNDFLTKIVDAGWVEVEVDGEDDYTWESNDVERKLDHIYIYRDSQKAEVKKEVNFYYDEANGFTDHSMLVVTLVFN